MANQIDDKPSLPKEYVQLEYLETTGTQWLDTGIIPNKDNYWVDYEAQKTSGVDSWIFGNIQANSGSMFHINMFSNSSLYCRYKSNNIHANVANNFYSKNRVFMNQEGAWYNDTKVIYFTSTGDFSANTTTIRIFGRVDNNGGILYPFIGRLYYFKLGMGDDIIMDLIPALRIADLRSGMYDLVSGQFFTNQGTGEFVFPDIPENQKPYLCFEALEDGLQVSLSDNGDGQSLEYSLDKNTWNVINKEELTPSVNAGSKVYFRGNLIPHYDNATPSSSKGIGTFSTTKKFNLSGTPCSLLFGGNISLYLNISDLKASFIRLFAKTQVMNVLNPYFIPCTALSNYCCYGMFADCIELIDADLEILDNRNLGGINTYSFVVIFKNCNNLLRGIRSIKTQGLAMLANAYENCYKLTRPTNLDIIELSTSLMNKTYYNCLSLKHPPNYSKGNNY